MLIICQQQRLASLLFLSALIGQRQVESCPFVVDSHDGPNRQLRGDSSSSGTTAAEGSYHHRHHHRLSRDLLVANAVADVVPIEGLTVPQAIEAAKADILCITTVDAHRAAEFVRLIFHDCVGGCNGCVDLAVPDNFGLEGPIDDLAVIAKRYSKTMTTADIWVLAAHTAAEARQPPKSPSYTPLTFPMKFVGRPSCDNPKGGPAVTLPSAHITAPDLRKFFATAFAFTDRDTTAIMGVHSLGYAESENSGFDGEEGWDTDPDTLDNDFYNILLKGYNVNTTFVQELQDNKAKNNTVFPNQFLWRAAGTDIFMLNADMALAKDFTGRIDPISGKVNCTLLYCKNSPLLTLALQYTGKTVGPTRWINDFRTAFTKMTNRGCESPGVCQPVV